MSLCVPLEKPHNNGARHLQRRSEKWKVGPNGVVVVVMQPTATGPLVNVEKVTDYNTCSAYNTIRLIYCQDNVVLLQNGRDW